MPETELPGCRDAEGRRNHKGQGVQRASSLLHLRRMHEAAAFEEERLGGVAMAAEAGRQIEAGLKRVEMNRHARSGQTLHSRRATR